MGVVRILGKVLVRIMVLCALGWGAWWWATRPESPIPPEWNPIAPLDVAEPRSLLTTYQLRRALASKRTCIAALETGASFRRLPPLVAGPRCGIDPRVELTRIGGVEVPPLETTCATALRLAMWERHALRPAATAAFGRPVIGLRHQGSYNCRTIRNGARMSSHATAEAVDVRAIVLSDGREVPLLANWTGAGPEARFWRAARDGACDWFVTVLGPAYDDLHADHLHMQTRGWGLCR